MLGLNTLGVLKTPRGGADRKNNIKQYSTRNNCQMGHLSILSHCKYSMKEYTTNIHLHFNMYYIIFRILTNK